MITTFSDLATAWLVRGAILFLLTAAVVVVLRSASAGARRLVATVGISGGLLVVALVLSGARVSLPTPSHADRPISEVAEAALLFVGRETPQAMSSSEAAAPQATVESSFGWVEVSWSELQPLAVWLMLLVMGLLCGRMLRSIRCVRLLFWRAADPPPRLLRALTQAQTVVDWTSAEVELRLSPHVQTPAALPFWRPAILLPATATDWPEQQLTHALAHELAHLRRRDPLWRLAAQFVRALHWPNPLAWWLCRRLDWELERAVDDQVVMAMAAAPSRYAASLLALASEAAPTAAVAMARGSGVGRRIEMILNPAIERRMPGRWTRVGGLAVGLLTAACIACAELSNADHSGTASNAGADATNSEIARPAAPILAQAATDVPAESLQAYIDEEIRFLQTQFGADEARVVVLSTTTGAVLGGHGEHEMVYPGSVMKSFLAATALEQGIAVDATVDTRQAHDNEIDDFVPRGVMSFTEVIATSSNRGAMQLFESINGEALASDLRKLKLPTAAENDRADQRALGIGVAVDATTLAKAFSVFANDGIVASANDATEAPPRVYSPQTVAHVRDMLEAVVQSPRGTGRRAQLSHRVAGKTGTTLVVTPNGRGEPLYVCGARAG